MTETRNATDLLILDWQQVCAARSIPSRAFVANTPAFQVLSGLRQMNQDAMTTLITTMFLSEKLEEKSAELEVSYPDGAWESWKDRYAPAWLLKRWPVKFATKYSKVTFTPRRDYPCAVPEGPLKEALGKPYLRVDLKTASSPSRHEVDDD